MVQNKLLVLREGHWIVAKDAIFPLKKGEYIRERGLVVVYEVAEDSKACADGSIELHTHVVGRLSDLGLTE